MRKEGEEERILEAPKERGEGYGKSSLFGLLPQESHKREDEKALSAETFLSLASPALARFGSLLLWN